MDENKSRKLIEDNLSFARSVASKYIGRGLSFDDLLSVSYMGLVKAASKYDQTWGHGFRGYAAFLIRGEMFSSLRNQRKFPQYIDGDLLAGKAESPEEVAIQHETLCKIKERLSDREFEVLDLYYGLSNDRSLTLEETGREIGLSEEGARKIVCKSLQKLRRYFRVIR